jgi:carboxymethylenebutenolidase
MTTSVVAPRHERDDLPGHELAHRTTVAHRGGVTKAVQDLMIAVERVHDALHTAVRAGAAVAHLLAEDATFDVLPSGVGATGADEIERFVAEQVVVPGDLTVRRTSRTGDRFRVVDEEVFAFTHDRELTWLLPGAPTGKPTELVVVTLTAVKRGQVTRTRMIVA